MPTHVYANNNEVASKAADGKSIAAFPDVCFSPPAPPVGPMPLPYPNTGEVKDTDSGTAKVFIKDKMSGMGDDSHMTKSMGDDAATKNFNKGMITGALQGKCYFGLWSMDVNMEGKGVPRHLDMVTHNHGSMAGNDFAGNNIDNTSYLKDIKNVFNMATNHIFSINFFHTENINDVITSDADYTNTILDLVKISVNNYILFGLKEQFVNLKINCKNGSNVTNNIEINGNKLSSSRVGQYCYAILYFKKPLTENLNGKIKLSILNQEFIGTGNNISEQDKFKKSELEGVGNFSTEIDLVCESGKQYFVQRLDLGEYSGNVYGLECTVGNVTNYSFGTLKTFFYFSLNTHYCDTITPQKVSLIHNILKSEFLKSSFLIDTLSPIMLEDSFKIHVDTDVENYMCAAKQKFCNDRQPYVVELFIIKANVDTDNSPSIWTHQINLSQITTPEYEITLPNYLFYDGVTYNNPINSIEYNGIPVNISNAVNLSQMLPFHNKIALNNTEIQKFIVDNQISARAHALKINYNQYLPVYFGGALPLRTCQPAGNNPMSSFIFITCEILTSSNSISPVTQQALNATLVHELGHTMRLVPTTSNYWYQANNSGPHCAYPILTNTAVRTTHQVASNENPSCTMYGTDLPGDPSAFCPICIGLLRKSNIKGGLEEWA